MTMKRLFFCMVLIVSGLVNAQIKVLEKTRSNEIGKIGLANALQLKITEQNNNYTFTYLDTNIKSTEVFRSFSFQDQDNDLENLYKLIMSGLDNLPEGPIELELPNDMVHLIFIKSMGMPNVSFSSYKKDNPTVKGQSVWLTKKKVDILFNRIHK